MIKKTQKLALSAVEGSKLKTQKYRKRLEPSPYNLEPNFGFTLVELMVVMAIIAILAATIWGNFFTSITKGKDSRRKQDLDSIAKALELYYNDMKAYPNPTNPLPNWGVPFPNPTKPAVLYMQKLPNDPAYPNASYCYTSDNLGTYYKLYANLENRNDLKVFVSPILCSTVYYNYGISSPNTTP